MEEILALKLDADWVVLSACNTGAGAGAGAEAASGLGRAFFYAGTRALLVTNWSVHSQSARELVTDLFRRQAADAKLTRGEALRQAMMALMDGPGYTDGPARPSSPTRIRCSGRPTPSSAMAAGADQDFRQFRVSARAKGEMEKGVSAMRFLHFRRARVLRCSKPGGCPCRFGRESGD